ncbi:MAG TPA: V-type ATP synthase subunit D [Candidatus Binataceae bacterium]|nr:V-type ATP synthase subunit D [Candidatus Binataceae bacterium]
MARFDVPATKANLLILKEDLLLAREGRELLDEKREIILREIFSHLEDLRRCRGELDTALAEAYSALADACLATGREGAARASLAATAPEEITMHERSVIGVIVPLLEWQYKEEPPGWGLLDTSLELDVAREKFLVALKRAVALAELEISFRRLAAELRKTQKRVNALSNLLIPQYEETVRYVESGLGEREREALFQLKRFRARGEH